MNLLESCNETHGSILAVTYLPSGVQDIYLIR